MLGLIAVLLVLAILASAVFVFIDGLNRKMNPVAVLFITAGTLLLWILFFPLYFFVRPDKKPEYVYMMQGQYAVPVKIAEPVYAVNPNPQPATETWLDRCFSFLANYKAETAVVTATIVIIYFIIAVRR